MGDLIQIYKLVHGIDKIIWCGNNKTLRPNQISDGRRHNFQLYHERTTRNESRTKSNGHTLKQSNQRDRSRAIS